MNQRQLFLQHLAQTSDFPLMLEIERSEGVYLYGTEGQEYIDMISGIGVSNVGHRHPEVLKAIQDQLDKYMHTMVFGEYVQSPQVQLAKALAETLPHPLESVYLVNSGSEAVEGALKLAKRCTARAEIISFKNAYHGSSHGALSATGDDNFKQNFRPLVPGFKHLEYNNLEQLDAISNQTAGVLVEVVQGEAGVVPAELAFLKKVRSKCLEVGALMMVDEIQTGFGRTGTFWAFEQYDIVPDVVISAKGMGGGMPIGCFVSSTEIMAVFKENPILGHITTFGGHPVSCASSLATLKVIQNEELHKKAEEKGQLIKSLLIHDKIKSIRSRGLMMAVGFESFDVVKPVIDRAIELGVITDWFLFNDYSMRIAPPLIITEEEIKKACKIILQACDEV
ncbi:MAG: aspartate aminotransferase family protein [Cyclobacteriaceae bacterium]